jgi:Ribosomal subunit 39S
LFTSSPYLFELFDLFKPANASQLVKRIMRITGRRIPDPAIASFQTAGDIATWMAGTAKPTRLADQLLALPELQALPNVRIHVKRVGRHDRDVEFGRAKVIERELMRRGLLGDGEQVESKEVLGAVEREA